MVKKSDDTPEAVLLAKQQARRLHHMRRAMGLSRTNAAAMAGVSRFTWRRMEEGKARIDAVPLRRFLMAYERIPGLPGEYVLSGSTAGLPTLLINNLAALDREDAEHSTAPSCGNEIQPRIQIASRTQHRRKESNGTSRAGEANGDHDREDRAA